MSQYETQVVTATKASTCERCAGAISSGEMIVFYSATRTVSHVSCHLARPRS